MGVVKSGGTPARIVGVGIAGAPVGVGHAEIAGVVVIHGPRKAPDRRQSGTNTTGHFQRHTQKYLLPLSVALHDLPDLSVQLVDLLPQVLGHIIQFLFGLLRL